MLHRGDGSSALADDFAHQAELVAQTRDEPAFAVFWEPGCGKTRPTIQTFVHWFLQKRIDGVIVVAPDGVHRNWPSQEMPIHCAIPWRALDWHSSEHGTQRQKRDEEALLSAASGELPLLALTYDALKTDGGIGFARRFNVRYPRFAKIVDESSRVKNGSADRTKVVKRVANAAVLRRILNGTPVSNSPLDVYSQMEVLEPDFWIKRGIGSLAAFKGRFCVERQIVVGAKLDPSYGKATPVDTEPATDAEIAAYEALIDGDPVELAKSDPAPRDASRSDGVAPATCDAKEPTSKGRTIKIIASYKNLDRLQALLATSSHRLTKEDAGLNLPPKLYQRLPFELAPEQRKAYDTLRKQSLLELDSGQIVTAAIALVKILRLHQIACGYLPNPDDPDGDPIMLCGGRDPRFELLRDQLEDFDHQMIIWCRFTLDVDRICKELGERAARYDGKVTRPADRAAAIDDFRKGNRQFFVAKPSAIGMGVTLVNTRYAMYYSNSYVLADRLQSEDRCHRIGQHNPVTYLDLEALRTVDTKILKSLRSKHDVAAEVVGDALREWLE